MISLAVCNGTQGNSVFLGGSQQHSRKVAYFLGFWQSRKSWTPRNFHFGVVGSCTCQCPNKLVDAAAVLYSILALQRRLHDGWRLAGTRIHEAVIGLSQPYFIFLP